MKKVPINENLKIKQIFDSALKNHENNNLKIAQKLYQDVLKINSNHAMANYNLGLVFEKFKEFNKAKTFYKKAIESKPDYLDAHNNLGIIFRELGDLKNAKICFQKVLAIDSNYAIAIFNLGVTFRELGEFEEAIVCYEKVIKIRPNFVKAHNNIGNVYKKIGKDDKAIDHFQKVLKLNPKATEAQVNISNVYISQLNNLKEAVDASHQAIKMHHQNSQFYNKSVPLYRLKHDNQQAKYLFSQNHKIPGINNFIEISDKILNRNESKENNKNSLKKILLDNEEIKNLLPFYKSNYIYLPPDITNGFINPNKNWKNVEDEYFNSPKQIIYIDNFLSEQAVKELRKFCLISKIWIEEKVNKYLGSYSDKGFISPLHLHIAIELKKKLPRLFGKARLGRFWAFKYDSSLGKGINIHADFALINLNFWITPDEFNNDKSGGGLKVYDTPAPEDWAFNKYNVNAKEIYKLLKKNKTKCVNVPYKFNRAVLFNSDYFHETDKINFKDEYEARRINITYLFGDRLFKKNI